MNYKRRLIVSRLLVLVQNFPVVVLSGARQVGKSTVLKQHFPEWDRVEFDPVMDIANARADPDLFLNNHPCPLILDEIQYCPEVVASIKRRVDAEKRSGMFVLTGSQQWSVLKSISESLAGRAVFLDLEGFCLCESETALPEHSWLEKYLDDPEQFVRSPHSYLTPQRTLFEQMWRGSLPEVDGLSLDVCSDYLSAYVRTYIERDVRLTLDVGDSQQFGRFVQFVSALTAQEVNHSQLGRELGVTPQTAKRWLAVLGATFQWMETPAYHGNTLKRISAKPKGYFADTGLICHLNRISSHKALSGHPLSGALFETWVVGEIRKLLSIIGVKPQLYHWRLHSGAEIDLVLERDGRLYPIEIKLNTQPSKHDARGLLAFRETYSNKNIAPGLIIAPCERFEQITEHDFIMPWNHA